MQVSLANWRAIYIALLTGVQWLLPLSNNRICAQTLEPAAKFHNESRNAWITYRDKVCHLQGLVEQKRSEDSKQSSKFLQTFKLNGTNNLCILEYPNDKWPEYGEAFGTTPTYRYQLIRNQRGAPWLIKGVALTSKAQTIDIAQRLDDCNRIRFILQMIVNVDIMKMAEQPEFRILSASNVVIDGKTMVSIEFENLHSGIAQGDLYNPIQSGTVVFDVGAFWCINRYKVQMIYGDAKQQSSGENTYSISGDGLPVPTETRISSDVTLNSGKSLVRVHTTKYDLKIPKTLPGESEFKLTAFGLSEPDASDELAPKSYWVIVVLCGITLLGLTILLRNRSNASLAK